MKDIAHYIFEEFKVSEASLKELSCKDVEKVLKQYGFGKKDYTIKDGCVYMNSEELAMSVADDLVDDYTVTYDDKDNFRLTLFK